MRVSRLAKIKGHWIFRDFVWPQGLLPFAQFNVIYGWNGSGKTALSSLFQNLQEKRAITASEVEFELDNGARIPGSDIPNANFPPVRVFNRTFVARTVDSIGTGDVAPIFFLGEESVEKQKQLEALKTELAAARDVVSKAYSKKETSGTAYDDFCVEKAKLIKESLLGSAEHSNYDKRRFKQAAARLKKARPRPDTLSKEEKESLRKQKGMQAKPTVAKLSVTFPDIGELRSQTSTLLKKSVVSNVIDELASDAEVGAWVQQGLPLHQGERETNSCRFCGNKLSPERRAELEAHFNDAFAAFQQDIGDAICNIEKQQQLMESISFPDESRFYEHLSSDFQSAVLTAQEAIRLVNLTLGVFKTALERKKATPFETLTLEEDDDDSEGTSPEDAVAAINAIIDKHEKTAATLKSKIRNACESLERNFVLEALPKFDVLSTSMTEAGAALSAARQESKELENSIRAIEREIVEHRRPAEELNQELRSYLGRDELQFDVKDTGYALTRGGQPASNLSEGERTAIAFLYFLKSLQDKDFDESKGVVVVDDPVSSLDANALFSAFGYMKERTQGCHQLIILTHSFAFFRQVKNWFHHLKGRRSPKIDRRPGRFYVLLATTTDGQRSATLAPIDPLLEQFESEYHFLFRQVHDVANAAAPTAELSHLYGIPNIARRLLETFLAYRYPDCGGDLIKRLERVDFEPAKKTRILRLLNTYSHSGGITDPEHDPSALAESGDVMKVILELIQAVDDGHYQGMIKLLQPVEDEQ